MKYNDFLKNFKYRLTAVHTEYIYSACAESGGDIPSLIPVATLVYSHSIKELSQFINEIIELEQSIDNIKVLNEINIMLKKKESIKEKLFFIFNNYPKDNRENIIRYIDSVLEG